MDSTTKKQAYRNVIKALHSLLNSEDDEVLKMATVNGVLKTYFPHYFWVGFYRVHEGALIVGPYQGTLGCLHIAFGKGVCGASAARRETVIVRDVHEFPGHISCDSQSNSEIVVPVFSKNGDLIAVFDVDSIAKGSFDTVDKAYLERLLREIFAS